VLQKTVSRAVARPTVFIKGNHEDFVWLDAHQDAEVLPSLTYLRNGTTRRTRLSDSQTSAA
jgi:hypothetical protein